MARGRMINKKISVSHRVNSLEGDGPFFYCVLIAHLDVCGRYFADPGILKGIIPLRSKATLRMIGKWLDQMETDISPKTLLPLVFRYEVSGVRYLEMPGFLEEQRGTWKRDREEPEFPPPPDNICLQKCGILPAECPQNIPLSRRGREGEGEKEVKEKVNTTTTTFSTWEECTGRPITGYEGQQIGSLIDEYTEEWVTDAIKEAAKNGRETVKINYISAILRRWQAEGKGGKKKGQKEDLDPKDYITKYSQGREE